MCGRFSLITPVEILKNIFRLNRTIDIQPRYNIAPTQSVPVIRIHQKTGERELVELRWGLVPHWAKDLSIGNKMINAKAETLFEKPSYKKAAQKRRCLIPADGFYEWRKEKKQKIPYYFFNKSQQPLALGGIWERWTSPEGEVVETFSIITTEANSLMQPIHNRMPLILTADEYDHWLDPTIEQPEEIQRCLQSYPTEQMEHYSVSSWVSNVMHEGAKCIQPVQNEQLF
ncbi:MAG: SOS response-associated peptidase [bacterium]|jgi:putative SOS response-associated peptidase YedK